MDHRMVCAAVAVKFNAGFVESAKRRQRVA
jgi:hypothetical protein